MTVETECSRDWSRLFQHALLIFGILIFIPHIDVVSQSEQWAFIAARNSIFPFVSFLIGLDSLRDIRARNAKINLIRSESDGEPH